MCLNCFTVAVTIDASLTRSNDVTSLRLSGGTSSAFTISSLSSVSFHKFTLNAALSIPNNGATSVDNLSLSGGVSAGSLGTGTGTFSYANQKTNFSMEVNPTLPKPFQQVTQSLQLNFFLDSLYCLSSA